MTGEEWLECVFERGLRIGDRSADTELLGGLRALAACGLLPASAAEDAGCRLHERLGTPSVMPEPDVSSLTGTARADQRPQRPARARRGLVDADGITVILTVVEVWTRRVVVHLGGLSSPKGDDLDDEFKAAFARWAELTKAERAAGREPTPPPRQPATRLMSLPMSLSDDVGTDDRSNGRSAAGSDTEWESRWTFNPGVPEEATRLTVTVEGTDSGPARRFTARGAAPASRRAPGRAARPPARRARRAPGPAPPRDRRSARRGKSRRARGWR